MHSLSEGRSIASLPSEAKLVRDNPHKGNLRAEAPLLHSGAPWVVSRRCCLGLWANRNAYDAAHRCPPPSSRGTVLWPEHQVHFGNSDLR